MNGKKIGGWIVRVGIAAVVGGECGGYPRNGIICSI